MECVVYRDYEKKTIVGNSIQLFLFLSVGVVLWRAVSYGLPRSLKPENTPNEHGKPENGSIDRKGHVWKLGESASVTFSRQLKSRLVTPGSCFKTELKKRNQNMINFITLLA